MVKSMRSFISLLKGILIGWLIGAGIGLVYAPRRGDETRNMLRERGLELREEARMKVEETRARAEDLAKKGQQTLNEQKVVLESTVEGIKEGVRTFQEEGHAGASSPDLPVPQDQASVDLMPDDQSREVSP